MPVIEKCEHSNNRYTWSFECPGCGQSHQVFTKDGGFDSTAWWFNGDIEKPSFKPSLKVSYGKKEICHFFINRGVLQFCTDSTHTQAGKKIPMKQINP